VISPREWLWHWWGYAIQITDMDTGGYGCRYTFLYLPASKQASEHPKHGQQLKTYGQNTERRPF